MPAFDRHQQAAVLRPAFGMAAAAAQQQQLRLDNLLNSPRKTPSTPLRRQQPSRPLSSSSTMAATTTRSRIPTPAVTPPAKDPPLSSRKPVAVTVTTNVSAKQRGSEVNKTAVVSRAPKTVVKGGGSNSSCKTTAERADRRSPTRPVSSASSSSGTPLRVVSFYDNGEEVKEHSPGHRSVSRSAGFKLETNGGKSNVSTSSAIRSSSNNQRRVDGEIVEVIDYVHDPSSNSPPKCRRHSRTLTTTERRQSKPSGVSMVVQTSACAVEELVSGKELMSELIEHNNLHTPTKQVSKSPDKTNDEGPKSPAIHYSPRNDNFMIIRESSYRSSRPYLPTMSGTSLTSSLLNGRVGSSTSPTTSSRFVRKLNSFPTMFWSSSLSRPIDGGNSNSNPFSPSSTRYASMRLTPSYSPAAAAEKYSPSNYHNSLLNYQSRRASERAALLVAKYL